MAWKKTFTNYGIGEAPAACPPGKQTFELKGVEVGGDLKGPAFAVAGGGIEAAHAAADASQRAWREAAEEERIRAEAALTLMIANGAAAGALLPEEGCRSLEHSLADATTKKEKDVKGAQEKIDRLTLTSADLVEHRDLLVADAKGTADAERAEKGEASKSLSEKLQKRIEELEVQISARAEKVS